VSPAAEPVSPIEVDARGLRCPLPVIRLAEAARDAPAGTRIVVLASDPAARHDIPAWCRMRGHWLLEVTELTGETGTNEVTGTNDLAGALSSAGADQEPQVRQPAVLRFVVVIRR
jgi:tRNA 2-thiouridine synthesizing protein A